MPHRLTKRHLALALLLVLPACAEDTTTTTTTASMSTSTTAPATTTVTAVTTTIPPSTTLPASTTTMADGPVPVHLSPFSEMGAEWSEQVFPYGETAEFLGTSPGGEGGSVDWGPDYGTQVADGTWWFLDAARLRLAHFSGDGNYLGQALVPEDLLVDGIYFQFQMPQALDDGSVAIGGFERPLLRLIDGAITSHTVPDNIPWASTDGQYLYGTGFENGTPLRIDPDDPVIEPVEWFIARDGSRYRVTVIEDEVLVELPDAGVTRTLQMRYSEDPGVIARGGVEVETGADGTIFILIYGQPMLEDPLDIGGLVTVSREGVVGTAEPTSDLFSSSDPGSPARLGVTPETSDPWLMVVGEDGVHVFTRNG